MRRRTLTTILLCLIGLTALPAASGASSRQLAVFEDNGRLTQSDPGTRSATLDELEALGVDVIKFQMPWVDVAPKGKTRPSGFDGNGQGDYPGWGTFDGLYADAKSRGFQVMIAIGPPAPGWATKKRGDRSGVDRPNATYYGRYAQAAAERFPGADVWTLWNEPNHPGFLYPQSHGGVPYAPRVYRALVRAGVAGLRRGGSGGDRILFGELLPIGKSSTSAKSNLKPIRFLRSFFCLTESGRRTSSARLGCRGYKPITGVNGFAYHPYTRPRGPRFVEGTSDDATIRSIGRVTRILDLARRRARIGGGRLSVWNTEFGYQSNPPDREGLSTRLSRIPGFINEAEWMSFRNSRVASYSQYTLFDDPLGGDADRFGSWQGGLRFVNGNAKPGVYEAYRLPFFVRVLGPSAVEVWGATRPGGAGSAAQVQERSGNGAYENLGAPISVTNARGYFKARFRIARATRRTYRFQSAGLTSRATKAALR